LYGVLFYVRLIRNVKAMLRISLVLLCLLTLSVDASAAVIISVQGGNVTTNGTGYVDVLISTSLLPEQLTTTTFAFEIGGSPNLTGSLEFVAEPDPATYSPPDYVFGGATENYSDSITLPTSISGSDSFEDGDTSVTITSTTQTLVRLGLKHTAIGDPSLAVGSLFTITMNPPGLSDFQSIFNNGTPGDFSDDVYTDLAIDPASSFSGTITITAAAVPEPSTFAIMAVVGAGVAGRKLRRRKSTELQNALADSAS
jgi:hypothetical protein